jgi:hypothetical protein
LKLKLILVPYIVAAKVRGGRRRYCKGLLIINEDNTSTVVVSRYNTCLRKVLIVFHELLHLAMYRLIRNLAARNFWLSVDYPELNAANPPSNGRFVASKLHEMQSRQSAGVCC